MDRRDFLKTAGLGAAALTIPGCKSGSTPERQIEGEMEYRMCGDDKVSLLGYGCMRWQMTQDADGRDIVDQESVNELVDYAMEHGVNYFDSSPVYLQGQSERAAALALRRYPRDSYYIATKMSNFRDSSFEAGVAMYKASLANYETDYIDYYLLHAVNGEKEFMKRFVDNGLMDFLMEERKAGHIRKLGFSFHGSMENFDYMMEQHDRYHWDFVLIQMNYVDWKHADDKVGARRHDADSEYLYGELDKREIPVVVMEPLLGGSLANLPDAAAERLAQQDASRSAASWAFRFVGSYPRILTVLSGMTYMEHLEDNLKSFCGFKPLNDKEKDILESVARLLATFETIPCTACQYCMPCPYGINIPGIFAHYNKCLKEGIMPDPKEDPVDSEARRAYRKARREYLLSYDRAIPTIRQADHCIACGRCVDKCPQGIKIPQKLQRIDRYVDNLKKN